MTNIPLPSNLDKDQLLSLAAFFDDGFSLDWLIELTGLKAGYILEVIDEGIQQGFLVKLPKWVFKFSDAQVQKNFQDYFSSEEKNYWKHQIVEMLLKESPNDVCVPQSIMSHLLHIQNTLRGCLLLFHEANRLVRAKSFSNALCCYNKILDDLSKISSEEADELFIKTAIEYSWIFAGRVDLGKAQTFLREAIGKACKRDSLATRIVLQGRLSFSYFLQSRYGLAIRQYNQSRELAKGIEDPKFLESLIPVQSFSFFVQGHLKDVIRSYEESAPIIENFSLKKYELTIACTAGLCYALNGHFSQGLGLLDAIQKHCLANDDQLPIIDEVNIHLACLMIQLYRHDEAISYLSDYIQTVDEGGHGAIRAKLLLSHAYYLKGQMPEAFHHLKYVIERRQAVRVPIISNDVWFKMCQAMEEGELPQVEGIRLEDEIQHYLSEKNILMKGMAYRYQAYLYERRGESHQKIIETLATSSQLLEEAGAIFEQCRTLGALHRQYMLLRDQRAARETRDAIVKILGSFSKDYVPRDLRKFVDAHPRNWESLVEEILTLSQDMSTIRDEKQLMQTIISTSNRITGAERGAIFGIKKNGSQFDIRLKASKNITTAQVDHKDFTAVKKLIKKVAVTGKGRIESISSDATSLKRRQILSQICVPMVVRNTVVGVLYHDNSFFMNSFKEADLKLLGYFANQAAIAVDNAEAYTKVKALNLRLHQETEYYKDQSFQNLDFKDIIGESQGILQVLEKIKQVANTGTPVLVTGETGVGKEVVARAIHNHSNRQKKPLIKVLCNALPENLISSELFGHEKGSFTGSTQRRIGRFELADGGTLFLDEIGDLPFDIQTSLLHVLQNKEFERVGGSQTIRSNFRLITATNRDLDTAVRNKTFRSDLYYRLNIFPIHIPPLRERRKDIPLLAYHFFKVFAARLGKHFDGIPQEEMNKLMRHSWPGNIRELEGIIERGVIMSNGPYFRVPELDVDQKEYVKAGSHSTLKEMEHLHILHTLEKTGWKVRGPGGAAELLDMNYSTLNLRMRKLGIVRPPEFSRKRKKCK